MSTNALVAAHPNTAALLPNVDFLQGAKDFAEGILGHLKSGADAILSPALPGVTDGSGFGTLADLQAAYAKIKEIVDDAEKHDLQEGIADGVDLLKLVMAALTRYRISYPALVGTIVGAIPSLHAGGVNKTA